MRKNTNFYPPRNVLFLVILLFFILASLVIATNNVQAQSTATPTVQIFTPTPKKLPTISATSTSIVVTDEVIVLRAQLETMRFYDQRILTTVYFSLGTVVTIALLVAGFSWFTNFKIYDRDKESLRNEFRLQIEKLQAEMNNEISKQKIEIRDLIPTLISSNLISLKEELSSEIKDLKTTLSRMEVDLYLNEAEIWTIKGIHANATTYYLKALEKVIDEDFSGRFPGILDDLLRNADKVKTITTFDMERVERQFSRLPPESLTIGNHIKEKFRSKLE